MKYKCPTCYLTFETLREIKHFHHCRHIQQPNECSVCHEVFEEHTIKEHWKKCDDMRLPMHIRIPEGLRAFGREDLSGVPLELFAKRIFHPYWICIFFKMIHMENPANQNVRVHTSNLDAIAIYDGSQWLPMNSFTATLKIYQNLLRICHGHRDIMYLQRNIEKKELVRLQTLFIETLLEVE